MKKISEVERNHSLCLSISIQVPVLKRGGVTPPPSPPPYFPVDNNVNVTLLLAVSSMALILTTDREKLNNLERKIIKSTCCRKECDNQPKKGINIA